MTTGCFRLSGDFDPDEITGFLGIEPTSTSRIGDPGQSNASAVRTTSIWLLSAKEESAGDIADQLIDLLTALRERADLVADLATRYDGIIDLISFRDTEQDSWFLSQDVLRQLSRLCVSLRCWNETAAEHNALKEWLSAN